jgi:ribosomal protein S18 acetylase RimI-like enzyme
MARAIGDAQVVELAGGVAVLAAASSPSNKMIGVGYSGAIETGLLADVEARFASQRARLQAEVSTLADPAVHQQLAARGYVPGGFENVLGYAFTALPAGPGHEVAIEVLSEAAAPALVDVMAEGFAHPDTGGVGGDATPPDEELRSWFRLTAGISGFRGYLARIDGDVAGGALMRLDHGVAQFSGAATLPRFRRRGVQTALLRARLADAAAAGCDLGVIVTQPASKSQQNAQREGFALLYARQLFVKTAG